MKYAVVIEKGPKSYGASIPDLPGCIAVGRTAREVKKLIAEALVLHLEDMKKSRQRIPKPSTQCEYIEV